MEESIKKLEEKVSSLKKLLALYYSRIDALECYPGNENEIEELETKTDEIEKEIAILEEDLVKLKKNNISKWR